MIRRRVVTRIHSNPWFVIPISLSAGGQVHQQSEAILALGKVEAPSVLALQSGYPSL